MSDNLIEEIKKAEKNAAAILEVAEREVEERLRSLREECDASTRDLDALFSSKKKEIIESARRDADAAIREQRAEKEKELSRLKDMAGKRMETITAYIITGFLGL